MNVHTFMDMLFKKSHQLKKKKNYTTACVFLLLEEKQSLFMNKILRYTFKSIIIHDFSADCHWAAEVWHSGSGMSSSRHKAANDWLRSLKKWKKVLSGFHCRPICLVYLADFQSYFHRDHYPLNNFWLEQASDLNKGEKSLENCCTTQSRATGD